MSIAVCLLLYAAVVCVVAPRLLPPLTRRGSAPRAAVVVWLIMLISVLASWAGAAAALVVYVARTWTKPDPLAMRACFAAWRSAATGQHGVWTQIGLWALTLVVGAFTVTLATRVGRSMLRARASSRRHARSAHIIGRRVAGVDGLVLDAPQKAAYCLAGRPGTIVITSAAIATLEPPHLDAVLAHERAHLAGRHHLLLAATRALAASLPRIRLFTMAETQIAELLEMCADDTAARRHGPAALLAAILALAGADPIPSAALGANTVGVCARVRRLTDPDTPAARIRARLLLTAATAVIVFGPVVVWAGAHNLAPHTLSHCGHFTA
jgi:Zn-dependent protease with chaperone function